MSTITIKELHRATGEAVRRAAASKTPVVVTDHGKPIAVLANPSLLRDAKPKWNFLPAFQKHILSKASGSDFMDDLDAVRGDR